MRPPRLDRLQLLCITNQHDFCACVLNGLQKSSHLFGRHQSCFIKNKYGFGIKLVFSDVPTILPRRQRAALYMGTVLQPFSRFTGKSTAKHSIACVLPYFRDYFEHGRFSCPCPSHDDSYALPVDQISDCRSLLLVEPIVTITYFIQSGCSNRMAFKFQKTDRIHSHSGFHPDQSFRGKFFHNQIFLVEFKLRPIDSQHVRTFKNLSGQMRAKGPIVRVSANNVLEIFSLENTPFRTHDIKDDTWSSDDTRQIFIFAMLI